MFSTTIKVSMLTGILTGLLVVSGASAQAGSTRAPRVGSGNAGWISRKKLAPKPQQVARKPHSVHAPLTGLLSEHVKKGWVDYKGLKAKEGKLDTYLEYFARTNPESLTKLEKKAFWINAYNAFTVKLILKKYPGIHSIKDYWGPWDKKDWVVNGKKVTLNYIEHQVLRKMGDPRIHTAIVCASFSCPDLASKAYEASTLDAQLDVAMKRFIENSEKGMKVSRAKGTFYGVNEIVYLSKIFSWFQDDFGNSPKAVLKFLDPYMTGEQKAFVRQYAKTLQVKYLRYGWQLNGK
jgi:hypothetical protein